MAGATRESDEDCVFCVSRFRALHALNHAPVHCFGLFSSTAASILLLVEAPAEDHRFPKYRRRAVQIDIGSQEYSRDVCLSDFRVGDFPRCAAEEASTFWHRDRLPFFVEVV
jgi:hypothetical protein